MKKVLLILIFFIAIAGCQSSVRYTYKEKSETKSTEITPKFSKKNNIVQEAEKWIGTPYCLGGNSKGCIDCSGFVKEVFLSLGVVLPRTASEQFNCGIEIPYSKRQSGDLIFFKKGDKIFHVGICVNDTDFIHSSSSKGVVIQSINNEYFIKHLYGVKRIVTD